MGEHGGTPEQGEPDLCDFCGAVVDDDTELYALVPDSSVIHAHDPKFDGKRLVSACTEEHRHRLAEQYRRRPFVDAEQWAGKVLRAVEKNRGRRIDDAVLVELTGLTVDQIHAGVAWHSERARAFRDRRDRDDGPSY
ncbi:hypothetical protein L3Q65_00575 (plasmid) [Amycolatopsis sp. FU40]|uniref:hypothetical protein n=1 Tax=Amycolatopsis sp. FU40 TaxID=2914159 RepID=UPI001F3067D7|nr:hypothetical protein [Amycolatopsis sp. FU40]UKD50823.1 hypothetical protein L3Q65_00575 [Amycolatopsis sp. FU40]